MSKLVPPHGGKGLVCCLLEGDALKAELEKAKGLKQVEISSRAKGDLIMMGIGGFSPLDGFMGKADWKSVCENMLLADGTFWPVPITLDISAEDAGVAAVSDPWTPHAWPTLRVIRHGDLSPVGASLQSHAPGVGTDVPRAWCAKRQREPPRRPRTRTRMPSML